MNTLTPQDISTLASSYITPELAVQARLFRVDSLRGAELVGRKDRRDYSGVAFPYVWPGEERVREYRLRRDRPELEQRDDGTLKERDKYLSPPGRGNLLYFVPGTPAEWLGDVTLPVAVTEGEKKTLALYRLAFHGVEGGRPRFLPIGLPGVWNWRGTVGKAADDKGVRRDVKGVIPDVGRVNWRGRTVYIIFDANVATNEGVAAARRELKKVLARRGATVRFVDLH